MPLVKGGLVGAPVQQAQNIQPQQSQQPEGNQLLRGLSQLVQGGAEGVAGLAELPGNLYQLVHGQPHDFFPSGGSVSSKVQSGLEQVIPQEYIQPQGRGEKFLRNLGSSIPAAGISLATGGAALPLLASTTGGALGETIGEEFGGPLGRVAGSLLGSAGFTKGFNALQRKYKIDPQDLLGTATKAQTALYDTEKELGKNITVPAKDYNKKLLAYEHAIKDAGDITSSQRTELLDKVKQAQKDIDRGMINASSLVDRKKQNNAFYRQFSGYKNEKAKTHLDKLQKIIFEEGENIGKNHPEWLSVWKDADDITSAIKYGEGLKQLSEEAPSLKSIISHPISKYVLGLSGLGGGFYTGGIGPSLALGAAGYGGMAAWQQTKYLAKFLESPATQKVLADTFKYTVQRQLPQVTKSLHTLNNKAKKYEQSHPEVKEELKSLESPKKFGLIKGGPV